MLQSIGALKSAIVVLSKHHSSLAQVRVLFGNGLFPPSARKLTSRRSTRRSLYATESGGVRYSFHWCTSILIFVQPGRVYLFLSVAG